MIVNHKSARRSIEISTSTAMELIVLRIIILRIPKSVLRPKLVGFQSIIKYFFNARFFAVRRRLDLLVTPRDRSNLEKQPPYIPKVPWTDRADLVSRVELSRLK